jgi:positive regulator of sigma E activity
MRFYWSYKSLPELSDLPAAEQRAAGRRVNPQVHERWQTWAVYLAFLLLVLVCRWIGSFVGREEIGTIVGVLISAAISGQIVFRMTRSLLKQNNSGVDRK